MASTVITPVADALKVLIEGIAVTPALKVYRWAPKDLDRVPAAVIDVPRVERTGIDEPESQLGSDDWRLTFEVTLYFDLSEAIGAQQQATEYFEAFAAAVDENPIAGVLDMKVTVGEPDVDESIAARPLFSMNCTVEALKLVAT